MKTKKKLRYILAIIVLIGALFVVYNTYSRQAAQTAAQNKSETIDTIIADAIMTTNSDKYEKGECRTEGHVVLKTEEKDDILSVYSIASYGEFGFENGIFTKISGSGAIPTVITFTIGKGDSYTLKDYKEPLDGSAYDASLAELFPADLLTQAHSTDSYNANLSTQEEEYASKYLKLIGREAMVQESNVEKELPDMNTQVSNELMSLYSEYPYWIGNTEKIEGGVRYVYQTDWQSDGNGDGTLTYTKSIYNGDPVEITIIQIKNGKTTYLEGTPRASKA